MGKVIMFDIPEGFRQESVKWTPPYQPGKVIEFRVPGTSLTHRESLTPELLSELTFCFAVNVLHGDPAVEPTHLIGLLEGAPLEYRKLSSEGRGTGSQEK